MAIEWTNSRHGSGCRATVGPGLHLVVEPDGVATRNGPAVPYMVRVFEATLSGRYDDIDKARAAAERAAKQWMTNALAKMAA